MGIKTSISKKELKRISSRDSVSQRIAKATAQKKARTKSSGSSSSKSSGSSSSKSKSLSPLQLAQNRLNSLVKSSTAYKLQQQTVRKLQGLPTGIKITTPSSSSVKLTASRLNTKAQTLFNTKGRNSREFKNIVSQINKLGYSPNVININKAQRQIQRSEVRRRIILSRKRPELFVNETLRPARIPIFKSEMKTLPNPLSNIGALGMGKKIKVKQLTQADIKKSFSTIEKAQKEKGLKGIRQKLTTLKGKQLQKIQTAKPEAIGEKVFRGVAVLGLLGGARGVLGVLETIRRPIQSIKSLGSQIRHPVQTFKYLSDSFIIDPVGTVAEFYTYSKTLNLAGKGIKNSKVGRFVNEELFIRSQPKQIQPYVRKIIKASKVQEKLNPNKIKSIKGVDFLEVKALTLTEAKALAKTLKETDSVVFGSLPARTLSKKRTPIPKDVDLATRNVNIFNDRFLKNLPEKLRKNYIIKKEKIIRASNGEAILDVKPLNRLIPQRNIITRRGRLPVVGYVNKLTRKKGSILPKFVKKPAVSRSFTIPTQKLVKLGKDNFKIRLNYKTKPRKFGFRADPFKKSHIKNTLNIKDLKNINYKKYAYDFHKIDKSKKIGVIIPRDYHTLLHAIDNNFIKGKNTGFYKILRLREVSKSNFKNYNSIINKISKDVPALKKAFDLTTKGRKKSIPTLEIKRTYGIKMIGFGEQTTRKALGTLQVLIEKNSRRAKDPQSLLIALEVQKNALKNAKTLTKVGKLLNKRKVNILNDAIKILKSKDFQNLLNSKVKGLTKEFPLVSRIKPTKLNSLRSTSTRIKIKNIIDKQNKKLSRKIPKIKKLSNIKSSSSKLPASRLSKLPASRLSKLPASRLSKLPTSRLSKLPISQLSKLPISKLSKLPISQLSKLPISKLSKLPISKLSKLPVIQLSKFPITKLNQFPISQIPILPPSKIPPVPKRFRKKIRSDKDKKEIIRWLKRQSKVYRPSLASVIYGITAYKIPKSITGFEVRPIIIRKRKR